MKSLRKSLNGNSPKDSIRSHISTPLPLPSISKPPSAILPPQKVIRALSNYRSQAPQELSFQKGDFFYVLRDVDNHGAWYEAHNPVSGARGLVPRSMFEEFSKSSKPLVTVLQNQKNILYLLQGPHFATCCTSLTALSSDVVPSPSSEITCVLRYRPT